MSIDSEPSGSQQFALFWVIHKWADNPLTLDVVGRPTIRPPGMWNEVWSLATTLTNRSPVLDASDLGHVATLWTEVEQQVQGPGLPALPDGRQMSIRVSAQHLARHVSRGAASDSNAIADLSTLNRNWEIHRDNDANFYKDHAEKVDVRSLSEAGTRAIHVLDGIARRHVAAAYQQRLDELASEQGVVLPPLPRHLEVFLSYRRSKLSLAKHLSQALASFGTGAHFKVFLDVHDTALGDWAKQYFDAIERADLFMALCTADYGDEPSFSKAELEHAQRIGKPIAIVVPGLADAARPRVWHASLSRLNACILPDETDVAVGNGELDRYFAMCVASLRSSSGA